MSKSKGNAVDPFEALQTYGADAIRWYFYINSAPWLPNRFHGKAVMEGQRKMLGTLWNTYAFFVLYANIDDFDATEHQLEYGKLSVMDKWLLSKLNSLVKTVDSSLNDYKIPEAARALQEFVDELSNWYVRRSRERFWVKGMPQDKVNAYMTLYTALVTVAKTAAPMLPFMSESIYQNLVCSIDPSAPESVHLCSFPAVREEMIDTALEADMEEVLAIVALGRAARNGSNIKNRQPISKMYVKSEKELSEFYRQIIEDELNIKEVAFVEDASAFTSYHFKPQLKTLGPKFGKRLGEIRAALGELDGNKAKKSLDKDGKLVLPLTSGEVELGEEDLLIETSQMEGYFSVEDSGIVVAIDTTLTPELLEEGFVREIISKIQTMRKEADFNVTDHILLYAMNNERVQGIIARNQEAIQEDVLADGVEFGKVEGYVKEWDINSEKVTLGVRQI